MALRTRLRRTGAPQTIPAPPGQRVVLHVGCGPYHPKSLHERFRGPEWHEVRLDIDPSVEPDVVASIVDLTGLPGESVDAVWSSHNIEHVWAHEVPLVLAGFFHVLRGGGEVMIVVPDLQQVGKLIAAGKLEDTAYVAPAGPISPLDMIYGHRESVEGGNDFMGHRTGFTAQTLKQKLVDAGFTAVRVDRPGDFALWATARKPG